MEFQAIERPAMEASNRSFIAHDDGLVVVVANTVERETKWEHWQGWEYEYGFLAKPFAASDVPSSVSIGKPERYPGFTGFF